MATTPGTSANDVSAIAGIHAWLDPLGLGEWADYAWKESLKGVPVGQIMLDIRKTPQYAIRFPGLDQLRKQGENWDEATYIQYENHAKDTLHFYGIPTGVFDSPQDLSKLMLGNVSTNELDKRVGDAAAALNDYSPEAMGELQQMYGIGRGGVLAYALDPKKAEPILARQFAASKIAGFGDSTGFGQIGKSDAELLAQQGVTDSQAMQGLDRLASEKELFSGLPGQGEGDISQQQQLGAEFSGNAADQAAILARQRSRLAQFGGSSQIATTNQGAVGLSTNQA